MGCSGASRQTPATSAAESPAHSAAKAWGQWEVGSGLGGSLVVRGFRSRCIRVCFGVCRSRTALPPGRGSNPRVPPASWRHRAQVSPRWPGPGTPGTRSGEACQNARIRGCLGARGGDGNVEFDPATAEYRLGLGFGFGLELGLVLGQSCHRGVPQGRVGPCWWPLRG